MVREPAREELVAARCWEASDRVPGRPATTAFRRAARLHQARWREANGHPIGSQPIDPKPGGRAPVRPVGSRIPLDHARATGANFLTAAALAAAADRSATVEPHQTLDRQRLWADLLWSAGLSCNLFGDLAGDLDLADRAVHRWWPDVPGRVAAVRFAHSPGRLDPAYLGNLVDLAATFELDLGDGTAGVLAVATRYHESLKREVPKPQRLARYLAVAEASGAFGAGSVEVFGGSDLLVLGLEHLLVLSMVQHPADRWGWARLVLVHPAGNPDQVEAGDRYRQVLADDATFAVTTIEDLVDAGGALPEATATALRERYVVT